MQYADVPIVIYCFYDYLYSTFTHALQPELISFLYLGNVNGDISEKLALRILVL